MPTYHVEFIPENILVGAHTDATDYKLWIEGMTPDTMNTSFRTNVDPRGMPRNLATAWLNDYGPDFLSAWVNVLSRPAILDAGKEITVKRISDEPK